MKREGGLVYVPAYIPTYTRSYVGQVSLALLDRGGNRFELFTLFILHCMTLAVCFASTNLGVYQQAAIGKQNEVIL